MTIALEIFSLRPGPDGLSRITVRCLGGGKLRSWLTPIRDAEDAVLDEWAELHDRVLGFPPLWLVPGEPH